MKTTHRIALLATITAATAMPTQAALLFMDNFNVADTSNFDGASTAGRLSGTLASTIVLKSANVQHTINGNQFQSVTPAKETSGRLRFQESGGASRFDFAAGTTGTQITSAGGMRFEFDFTRAADTGDEWVSFSAGFTYADAEPKIRVNDAATDFGILFRNTGGTQRFDNGTVTATGSFTASSTQHVTIDLLFSSFANGETVTAISRVDGVEVDSYDFTWANNDGKAYFELGAIRGGTKIDNLAIYTIPEPSTALLSALGTIGLFIRRRK